MSGLLAPASFPRSSLVIPFEGGFHFSSLSLSKKACKTFVMPSVFVPFAAFMPGMKRRPSQIPSLTLLVTVFFFLRRRTK